jgi:hypothetical protein
MRHALLGTILLVTATAGLAQNRPSMIWEGDVNGTAILMIRGDRVDVDAQSARSVTRTSYRFNDALNERTRITVENRLGNATARVIEQPRRNNDFTATVEIRPRRSGWQRVSLDFYWDDRDGTLSRDRGYNDDRGYSDNREYGTRSRTNDRVANTGSGFARWSGEVDNEVFVLLRGRQFFNTAVRGRSVYGQQVDVSSPLPRNRQVYVNLQDIQGRGQVELVEQPDRSNNFTAKVRIVDPQAGAGSYSFSLAWDESGTGYNNNPSYGTQQSSGGVLSPSGGAYPGNDPYYSGGAGTLRWAARVDGRVRVSFRDNQAYAQRLTGQPVSGEQVQFSSPLPRRAVNVEVRKLSGRDDVSIVQQPSPNNNYTLVLEINDSSGGADLYDLEIRWQ